MNAEFNVWLLLVGLVVGAGLVYLVLADMRRREDDIDERERAAESAWIARTLNGAGDPVSTFTVDDVLRLHRMYLAGLPADEDAWVEPADLAPDADPEIPGEAAVRPGPAPRGAPPPQTPGADIRPR